MLTYPALAIIQRFKNKHNNLSETKNIDWKNSLLWVLINDHIYDTGYTLYKAITRLQTISKSQYMKLLFSIFLLAITITVFGQPKYNYTHFNKLTEVTGTDYVIASIDTRGKISELINRYLLFIDTRNGSTNQVDFPSDGYISQIEQVKIDKLEINKIIVTAKTVDLDGKGGIGWSNPQQIFILSTDGKEKNQLTDDKFFTSTWSVNQQTGTIVITGHHDTNENGKYDKEDNNSILIFDLKTLELKGTI